MSSFWLVNKLQCNLFALEMTWFGTSFLPKNLPLAGSIGETSTYTRVKPAEIVREGSKEAKPVGMTRARAIYLPLQGNFISGCERRYERVLQD